MNGRREHDSAKLAKFANDRGDSYSGGAPFRETRMAGTTMNISVTPELDRFVQEQVAGGLYQSASEVVREALRLLVERKRAELRAAIDVADVQARSGRGRPAAEAMSAIRSQRKPKKR